jgi:hypothetical protein
MGTGGLLSCSSLDRQVRLLMVQTFIYSAVMYGAEGGTKAVKDKMSAVVKALRHSSPASRDCSSDVLWGHWATSPGVLIDAAKLCWQHRSRTWRLMARRRCDSHSRVAVVSRPKVGTDWCGNVKSITEQIQHTLNIAKVTAQARVNQPCVG